MTMTQRQVKLFCAIAAVLTILQCPAMAAPQYPASADDWPMFRHDFSLTGMSPLRGRYAHPPQVASSIDLGHKLKRQEEARVADVDGDGLDEILLTTEDQIRCLNRAGKVVWQSDSLPRPTITDISDLSGRRDIGILLWSDDGVERTRYVLSGKTGKAGRLYSVRNLFGMDERIGRLLPDIPGKQLCAWWSGENPAQTSKTVSEGYLFTFENGVENPAERFKVNLDATVCAPRFFFTDFDLDGQTELVVVSHQQAWFFVPETGEQKLYIKWPMIRTYSSSLAMLPATPGARPSLFSINPHIPGVERVDIVDGQARVAWHQVVGKKEDQYQTEIKITAGAPDPFLYLANDGRLFILAKVTNEHQDGKSVLVVFDGATGARICEEADCEVLSADDLDGDGRVELLIRQGNALRIAQWSSSAFVDRWRGEGAAPLLVPLPPERDLARNVGGNTPVWRDAPGGHRFLMQFPDGAYACALNGDSLNKESPVTVHEALHNAPKPQPEETVSLDGGWVVARKSDTELFRYELHSAPTYMAPPAVVGDLGGKRRVLVQDAAHALLSCSACGDDRRAIVPRAAGASWSICDMDGDHGNEVLTVAEDDAGQPSVMLLRADGTRVWQLRPIEHATGLRLAATGRLNGSGERWLAVAYDMAVGSTPTVAAYRGKTGELLWTRDHFECANSAYGEGSKVKFVLHCPTSVCDYDGDGTDDLLAASENFFGIMSVSTNNLLTAITPFSDCVPGHWQAYAKPILADFQGKGRPQVFHHAAFSQTIVTDLEGTPIWHWGLTRDTTPTAWPGIADLDGDGKFEVAQSRADGMITVFGAEPEDRTCPTCPPGQELTAANHCGHTRWQMRFAPPISDMAAADLDDDGEGELLFGAGDGKLYAVKERDGKPEVMWTHEFGRHVGSPVLADLNGDHVPEILVPIEDGRLVVLSLAP